MLQAFRTSDTGASQIESGAIGCDIALSAASADKMVAHIGRYKQVVRALRPCRREGGHQA
jgi:hypothetical protein